jgi:hypothetical protein
MINDLRNQIYNVKCNATDPKLFESMLITSTFSSNYTSILIWLSLALASTLYLIIYDIAFIMYLRHKRSLNPRHPHPQQPQVPMEPLVNHLYIQQNHALLIRQYSLTKAAARSYCLDIPPQIPRHDSLSLQSHAALYNMRHPAAINSASTNTLYKPRYP